MTTINGHAQPTTQELDPKITKDLEEAFQVLYNIKNTTDSDLESSFTSQT